MTYRFTLEDGSGFLVLEEDASAYLIQEEAVAEAAALGASGGGARVRAYAGSKTIEGLSEAVQAAWDKIHGLDAKIERTANTKALKALEARREKARAQLARLLDDYERERDDEEVLLLAA